MKEILFSLLVINFITLHASELDCGLLRSVRINVFTKKDWESFLQNNPAAVQDIGILHHAIKCRSVFAVDFLLQQGADPNKTGSLGRSAMQIAIELLPGQNGNQNEAEEAEQVVKLLADYGGDLNVSYTVTTLSSGCVPVQSQKRFRDLAPTVIEKIENKIKEEIENEIKANNTLQSYMAVASVASDRELPLNGKRPPCNQGVAVRIAEMLNRLKRC